MGGIIKNKTPKRFQDRRFYKKGMWRRKVIWW